MRVAIITRFPKDPASPHGGVESVSVNLVRALARLGELEVHVVTTDPACPEASESTWEGVPVHRLAWGGRRWLSYVQGAGRQQMQEFLKRLAPNVIHSHDVYGIMVQGMAVPRVFTVHGFIHGDALLQKRLPRLRSWLWKRVETAGWADQPHIVSISPYVRERLTGIAQGVIHDIDNPISDRFFGVERAEQPQRVFSAAHISRRKNPVSLIRAFGRLSQMGVKAELRLAGAPSNDGYLAEVKAAISEMHLESSVRLLGKLDYQAVLDELKLATVFALVSLEENSPMGIEEAMAVGVPVVTSNRCGMPYMVRDGETGFLVNPNDPDDIASRLRDVLTASPSRRKEMSDKSRQVALDRFHPRRIAERTREVYLRAIHDFRNHGR